MTVHKYSIEFYSYWHCGSGLTSGAEADALVLKNDLDLPYVPGKTVKGVLRHAADELVELSRFGIDSVEKIFGSEGNQSGTVYFSNAEIQRSTAEYLMHNQDQIGLLYTLLSSTALNEHGVAVDHSLRTIEVAVPMTLSGEICNMDDADVRVISQAMGMTKAIGSKRNSGLGRCSIYLSGGGAS